MSFSNIVWSPLEYREADVLAREVGDELLSRLEWMTLQPSLILDIGCGTGELSGHLQTRYPAAKVLALDASYAMIEYAHKQHTALNCICAEAATLPLRNQTVDLIVANFLLPWHANHPALLREWRRVLRPNGLLIFTAFGPDTLKQWQTVFAPNDMPQYVDMHDIGDLLLHAGFADPVLDVNLYTLTYREKMQFCNELKASGMWFPSKNNTLTAVEGFYEAIYEVIFAHAFTPTISGEASASEDGIVKVPLSVLRGQLSKK